jgi:hypothetical protein
MRTHAALSALLSAVILAVAPMAEAEPPAPAVQRYAVAKKHYDAGAYAEAYEEFRAIAQELGSPNAELYMARCLRALGRLPEAYEAMRVALRDAAAKAVDEPRYAETRDTAAAQLAELEPLIGKLIIAVVDPPPDLIVEVNGTSLPRKLVGAPVPAAVGDAFVRVRARGKQDVERRVTLRGGEVTTITVALAPIGVAPERPAPPPPPGLGGLRIAGIAVLGVGAAGMATFAVAGAMASHRYATLEARCGNHCTSPEQVGEIEGGRRLDLAANVALGAGLAGLVAGAGLLVFGRPRTVGSPPAQQVTAWATPGGVIVGLRGAL